jgi:hypothetical protein
VRYGSTAELQAFNTVFCFGSTGTGKTVNVTVAGVTGTDFSVLTLGTSFAFGLPGAPAPVFEDVPDGVLDLVGVRATFAGGFTYSPNRLFVQRGITPAAGTTVAVDFNGANSSAPVPGTVMIGNLGADQATMTVGYFTANRTFAPLSIDALGTSATRSYAGFAAFAGSFHFLAVAASPAGSTPDRSRSVGAVYGAVANRTVTLGPDLSAVTVTAAATTPSLRLHAAVPTQATYNTSWSADFAQGTPGTPGFRGAFVQSTAAYLVTVPTTVTLTMPDLSGVAGFQPTWALANVSTEWSVLAAAISGFGAAGQWQEGATQLSATRSGMYSTEQQNQDR